MEKKAASMQYVTSQEDKFSRIIISKQQYMFSHYFFSHILYNYVSINNKTHIAIKQQN